MGHVLVVEPNPAIRNWCRLHLSTAGHQVNVTDEARRAVRLARSLPVDLVLIASDMEGATAYALAAALRSDPDTEGISIIFLVPAEDAPAIAQASSMAPGGVLTKPLSRDALLAGVAGRIRRPAPIEDASAGGQSVPAPAVRASAPQMLSLESKTVSILVVTLHNLVSLARSLRGKNLDALVQRFMLEARDSVAAQGGWVVRLEATGLLAIFENTPNARQNHASLAIEAALYVMLASRRVKQWAEATLRESFPGGLSVGCGIHSGDVVVARLPIGGQVTPSLAGVTVDIATRLNGRAKGLGWSVVASESAAQLAGARFRFDRRATLTDTDHDLTIPILECAGFQPRAVLPDELMLAAEIREAVLAGTLMSRLAGDVDPSTAERTMIVGRARMPETPPELPDRTMSRRLGHGRQVTTYLALHVPTGREEAVKTLRLSESPCEPIERYLAIYREVAQVGNPHLVTIHEVGQSASIAYVAAELLRGPTLSDAVRRRVPVGVAMSLLAQICQALSTLHGLGMHHGALRAAHFLFRDDDTIVLADFNASAHAFVPVQADQQQTQSTPRQSHLQPGVRSDLRSAGLMLLAMLTSDPSVTESALTDRVSSLAQISRLPVQLSSLQPFLDGMLGLPGTMAFESADQALAVIPAVEDIWSSPAAG